MFNFTAQALQRIAKSDERNDLPGRKQCSPSLETVGGADPTSDASPIRQVAIKKSRSRFADNRCVWPFKSNFFLVVSRCHIHAASSTIGNDRHQPLAEASSLSLRLNVTARYWRFGKKTNEVLRFSRSRA